MSDVRGKINLFNAQGMSPSSDPEMSALIQSLQKMLDDVRNPNVDDGSAISAFKAKVDRKKPKSGVQPTFSPKRKKTIDDVQLYMLKSSIDAYLDKASQQPGTDIQQVIMGLVSKLQGSLASIRDVRTILSVLTDSDAMAETIDATLAKHKSHDKTRLRVG